MFGSWQKRWHPLLEQWVIIASTSAARPWSGAMVEADSAQNPAHDTSCYLCPRVERAGGSVNPDYRGAYAFDNDFPSLSFDAPVSEHNGDDPVRCAAAHGRCRVLCWSHRHDATLATLSKSDMVSVAQLWQHEYSDLAQDPRIAQVCIFENKGTEIGVSNLHPHGQIYATDFVSDSSRRMRDAQARYANERTGLSLVGEMLRVASQSGELMVERSDYFSVMVPRCARFSFETWIVPHRHVTSIAELDDDELSDFALTYQRQVRRYDALFRRSAPNITLLHNAPVDDHADNQHWHFHLVFQPPLRDPQRLKYLAGFESGSGNIINPMQPEAAADQLRSVVMD